MCSLLKKWNVGCFCVVWVDTLEPPQRRAAAFVHSCLLNFFFFFFFSDDFHRGREPSDPALAGSSILTAE